MPDSYRGVKDYIWDKDLLKAYFNTRNSMVGSEYSTKFAPWLALGNVSPLYVTRECRGMAPSSSTTPWETTPWDMRGVTSSQVGLG